ncbi:MAG: hypothetical protein ABIH67_03720 [Candidatus Uhrbacteria bacterium]
MKLFQKSTIAIWMILLMIASVKSASAMALAPAMIESDVQAGQVIEQEIGFINTSSQTEIYNLSTLKFEAGDEQGSPLFVPYDQDHSGLPEWIAFPENQIEVASGQVSTMTISIAVPNDASAGGHYAAIIASVAGVSEQDNVNISTQVASLVLLNVQGSATVQANLIDFIGPKWVNRLPTLFQVRIQNQGDVHIKPQGTITINDTFGAKMATLDLNLENGRILPGSSRQFDAQWLRVVSEKKGFFEEIKNEWNNFGLGRYTAELELHYNDNSEPLTSSITFWIIPWHLGLVAVFIAVLMLLISRIKINLRKKV